MGDWVLSDSGDWVHDPNAATPITLADYDPSATRIDLPVVTAGRVVYDEHVDYANQFTHDDGSVYVRPDPDEFPCFDDVDSTTIVDGGGPDD